MSQVSRIVFVADIVFLAVRSGLLVTMNKCLKGHPFELLRTAKKHREKGRNLQSILPSHYCYLYAGGGMT